MLTNKVQITERQEAFVPLAVLENAFRYWWVVALLIVVGGLGGLLVHSFHPPLYEARAQFSVAIDYVSTGSLTQYEEDLAINSAGHIFNSTAVLQNVVNQANKEGIPISLEELAKQISLERQFSTWNLRVRNPDTEMAKRIATIWIDQGQNTLLQSYQHAVQAHQLELYIQSQESCLEKAGASEPSYALCSGANFTDIQNNLLAAGAALYAEKQASWGLFYGLTLGPFNPPEVSARPVTSDRNQYVFLGSLLGLLLAIAFLELSPYPYRRMKS